MSAESDPADIRSGSASLGTLWLTASVTLSTLDGQAEPVLTPAVRGTTSPTTTSVFGGIPAQI